MHSDLPGSNSDSSKKHRNVVTPRRASRKSVKSTSGHAGQHGTCQAVSLWLTVSKRKHECVVANWLSVRLWLLGAQIVLLAGRAALRFVGSPKCICIYAHTCGYASIYIWIHA